MLLITFFKNCVIKWNGCRTFMMLFLALPWAENAENKNSKISMIIRISKSYLRSRDMNFNSNSSFVVSYSQSTTDFNLIRKVNEKSGNGIFWSVLNGNDLIQRVVLSSRSSEFAWHMFCVEKDLKLL